ncbi:hypothetical protein AB0D49_25135 [Streptomyces sp. NPDC048290]|uniref:hypothetical protein n=1 Tax=Streptomyces sp. NPDC048290 TaxID=3155811 RepID=UPI00342F05BF
MNALIQQASGGSGAPDEWPMLYLGVVAVLAGFGVLVNVIVLYASMNVDQPGRTGTVAMLLLPWIGLAVAWVASMRLGLDAVDRGRSPWWYLLAGAGAHLGALAVVVLLAWSAKRRAERVRARRLAQALGGADRHSGPAPDTATRRADRDSGPTPGTATPGARTGATRAPSKPAPLQSAPPVDSPRSHEEWQARVIRRPDDVGYGIELPWQAEKYVAHHHRLLDRCVPLGCHPGERATAGDALAVLALGESIHREVFSDRAWSLHAAMRRGATWNEVAAALDVTTGRARSVLRSFAEGQRELNEETSRIGDPPLGYSVEEYRSALALIKLADDARSPSAT